MDKKNKAEALFLPLKDFIKIVLLEPHPDDLLFGPEPILLDWKYKLSELLNPPNLLLYSNLF